MRAMIFYYVGLFILAVGVVFRLFPSKHVNRIYGYRSPQAEKSLDLWRYAQKVSGNMAILMGSLMFLFGSFLKWNGWTNFFLIELMVLVFPIIPIFVVTEEKLKKYEDKSSENAGSL